MAQVLECPQLGQPVETGPATEPQQHKRPSPPHLVTGWQVVQLAAFFGLATGFIESTSLAWRRYVMGEFIFFGDSVFYLSPVAQAVAAVTLCLPLALVFARRRECSEHLVVTLLVFFATYNTALLIPNLHYLAELMLALGVATQAGRWMEKHPGRVVGAARPPLWFAVAGVALLAIAVELIPAQQERRSLANLAAADAAAPNILLVVLDTVRSDALDLDSDLAASHTPNLLKLGKEGFVFQKAYSTCPWTLPSHASMMTSRLPHELSSGWSSGLDDRFPTIAEWLQERGYKTAGFVGNTHYCSRETGLDRGFIHYEDFTFSLEQLLLSTAWGRYLAHETFLPIQLGCYDNPSRRGAPEIRRNLAAWLDTTDQDRAFFVMVNLFDAHDPYVAPKSFQRYTPDGVTERAEIRFWWRLNKDGLTEAQVENQQTAYEDCIAHLDDQVGLMLEELRQRGALENTLVIVTADHGEHFGDHSLYGHGNSLYEASIHVPMILWSSNQQLHNRSSDDAVSVRDLPATIAEYAGDGASHPFVGRSLLGYMTQEGAGSEEPAPVYSQIAAPSNWPTCGGKSPVFRGPMKSVLYRGVKYIRNGDGVEEAYDVVNDPQELNDLSDSLPEAQLRELRDLIDRQEAESSGVVPTPGDLT